MHIVFCKISGFDDRGVEGWLRTLFLGLYINQPAMYGKLGSEYGLPSPRPTWNKTTLQVLMFVEYLQTQREVHTMRTMSSRAYACPLPPYFSAFVQHVTFAKISVWAYFIIDKVVTTDKNRVRSSRTNVFKEKEQNKSIVFVCWSMFSKSSRGYRVAMHVRMKENKNEKHCFTCWSTYSKSSRGYRVPNVKMKKNKTKALFSDDNQCPLKASRGYRV